MQAEPLPAYLHIHHRMPTTGFPSGCRVHERPHIPVSAFWTKGGPRQTESPPGRTPAVSAPSSRTTSYHVIAANNLTLWVKLQSPVLPPSLLATTYSLSGYRSGPSRCYMVVLSAV